MDDRMAIDVVDASHAALLDSCFEASRIWSRTERANLDKNPSMRLSLEPCLGVKVCSKRPTGRVASQVLVSLDVCDGMIVENQFDRSVRRMGGIDKPEELDELSTAVAVFDKLPVSRSIPTIRLSIPRRLYHHRAQRWSGRQALAVNPAPSLRWSGFPAFRRRRRSSPALLAAFPWQRLPSGLALHDRRTGPPPSLFELGVAIFKVVAHLVRLDFLLAEDLAHLFLDQISQTCMLCCRPLFARMARQEPRRP